MDAILTVHTLQPRSTQDLLMALQQVREASIDADERLRREPGIALDGPLTIGMPATAVDQLIAELDLSLTRAEVIEAYRRELRKVKAIAVISTGLACVAAAIALLVTL